MKFLPDPILYLLFLKHTSSWENNTYPGSWWTENRESGIHFLLIPLISQKSWKVRNYRVISMYTYCYIVCTFSDQGGVALVAEGLFRSLLHVNTKPRLHDAFNPDLNPD